MHLLPVVGMSEVQCETLVAGVREPRHQWRVEVSSTDPVQAHGEQSHPIKSLPSILKHRRPAPSGDRVPAGRASRWPKLPRREKNKNLHLSSRVLMLVMESHFSYNMRRENRTISRWRQQVVVANPSEFRPEEETENNRGRCISDS